MTFVLFPFVMDEALDALSDGEAIHVYYYIYIERSICIYMYISVHVELYVYMCICEYVYMSIRTHL